MNTTHHTHSCVHDTVSSVGANNFGMNDRIKRLRRQTFEAQPSLSIERALIETRFIGRITESIRSLSCVP